jgi:hypothetical protein
LSPYKVLGRLGNNENEDYINLNVRVLVNPYRKNLWSRKLDPFILPCFFRELTLGITNSLVFRAPTLGSTNSIIFREPTLGSTNSLVFRLPTLGRTNSLIFT